jgi:glycosyltransferase involved in cell wall biosynthesis
LKNKNIVIIGQQDWDIEIGSNCKNIALEFSKNNRVLYVNNPLDRKSIILTRNDAKIQKRLKLRENGNHIEQINKNLWNLYPSAILESVNWIGNKSIFDFFNRINNKRFAKSIAVAIEKLEFCDYILFNDNLILRATNLEEFLNPSLKIYYLRDNLIGVPYFRKHGLKAQEELITKWDLTLANSDYLANYAKEFNPRSYMIGQGCDLSLFNDSENNIQVPDELKSIPKPIIGYTGFITAVRLDIELLEKIARLRPDWSLVLVGPEDKKFIASNLHKLPNVYFLGNKPPGSLPGYIKGFDIAINPQLINETTEGNYPRKIDEYLAMGKPTVATKTPFMDYFKEHTYLATGTEEYLKLIEIALAENTPEKVLSRKNYALNHTWEKNVETIYSLINNTKFNNLNSELC